MIKHTFRQTLLRPKQPRDASERALIDRAIQVKESVDSARSMIESGPSEKVVLGGEESGFLFYKGSIGSANFSKVEVLRHNGKEQQFTAGGAAGSSPLASSTVTHKTNAARSTGFRSAMSAAFGIIGGALSAGGEGLFLFSGGLLGRGMATVGESAESKSHALSFSQDMNNDSYSVRGSEGPSKKENFCFMHDGTIVYTLSEPMM